MGNLKPIGSEKLEGMAKVQRMIEIARYNESKPQSINESSSNEYSIKLADGLKYHIVKEKNGYVIKKGLNESTLDYVEPMKGRKYYSSYSEALKRLNLITKEVNILEGKKSNVSLFTEGEEGEKKYFLKRNTNEQAPPPPVQEPAPVPAPAPTAQTPAPEPTSGVPIPDETEMTEPPMPEDELGTDMPEEQPTEEVVTFKTIQKLAGKLGQKLRALNTEEENKMSSKDVKYVINSILSALDLNSLEDEDKEEIMTKFEGGGEEMTDMEGGDEMSTDMETPNVGDEEMTPEPPPAPETQEDYSSIDEDDDMNYSGMDMEETWKMDEMIEGIFSESKVDKILKKYFKIDEKEKKVLREKKEKRTLVDRISEHTETVSQKVAVRKFINENKNVKFLGKTESNNLVFERDGKRISITKKGRII